MVAAADELSVTHGAVSRQIRLLEESLGLPLLAGTRKSPALTAEGRTLLPDLTAAFDQIEAALQDIVRPEQETLDVSCLSSLMMRWLIPRLYRFKVLQPAIEVRLSAADGPVDIERDRFDVVITVGDGADPRLKQEQCRTLVALFQERLGPVVSQGLASDLRLSSPRDLEGKLLLRTRTRPDAWAIWGRLIGADVAVPAGPEFEHYYFTLEAAGAGLGLCLTPHHLVASDIETGRLLAPFGFAASGYTYFAVHRRQRRTKGASFCAWLEHETRELR